MKTCSIFSRWLPISLALFAMALLVKAETGKSVPAADGGLQMSLNTAAYKVYAGDPPAVRAKVRTRRTAADRVGLRDVLVASVQLANRSPQDLTFTFADEAAAQRRFDFRVFDSQGEVVWSGGGTVAEASTAQSTTATLRKRSKWSSVVRIPLKLDGAWLSPGIYTLEAALAGEPRIGATTLFEIGQPEGPTPPPEPPALGSIKGQVFRTTATNEVVVVGGANIVIEEILPANVDTQSLRPRFRWTGLTNAEGRFEVQTPPGRFRVTSTWSEGGVDPEWARPVVGLPPYTLILPSRASKEVTVTAGQVSEVRLDLKAGLVEIGTKVVYSVSSVSVRSLPTFAPPTLLEISAEGMVNTGGWSNAELRQRRVTEEGIIEFDFVAKPPEGIATQAFAPISAKTTVPQPSNFRGVRVFARTNSEEAVERPQ